MTVTYTAQVATCKGLGCFLKLLRRWRGSIYKLVWMDLLLFLSVYYLLNITYRFVLDEHGKKIFEEVVNYCHTYSDLIPISFVLGFYVTIVMTRWWNQYVTIPWPDPLAVYVSASIHGQDERGRVMRRTIMRYICLSITMLFTMVSPRVKKRFPTVDHFVEAGLVTQNERDIMNSLDKQFPGYAKYWLPIIWASSIVTRARKEGRIRDDFAVKTIIDELNKFRGQCGLLLSYDAISVPLVYTQVVTLAVYSYFITSLMGHQWVQQGDKHKIDLYFPVFTTLQFFFYMGWLKVAETLINPFGDDDDDFEVNWMVDRNLQVSYLIVDEMHHEHPELVKDQYWDEVFPAELPHTLASEPFRDQHPQPSTANIAVKQNDAEILGPSSVMINNLTGSYDENDMQSKPFQFSAPTRQPSRTGSQTSVNTTTGSMQRINSVTGMLKRLFSKEDQRPETQLDQKTPPIQTSGSATNLDKKFAGAGSMKITDQVIEEVDEQLTMTSQKSDHRPSVFDAFGPPPASEPINVPSNTFGPPPPSAPVNVPMKRSSLTSMSAPAGAPPRNSQFSYESTSPDIQKEVDTVSIGGSSTDSSDDEFTRLKEAREEERRNKIITKLARSLSSQPPDPSEQEIPLLERTQAPQNITYMDAAI